MWWIDPADPPTIATFLCPAIRDGCFRELFWVVPDATWHTRVGVRAIRRHLKVLAEDYPGTPPPVVTASGGLRTSLAGRPLTICALGALPLFDEPVLLDVDTDYLLIPRVSFGESDRTGALPWCWPEQLVERLRERHVRSNLTTVAYSVNGGYTPLAWKHFGDELALRLAANGRGDTAGYEHIRQAAIARVAGARPAAEEHLRLAAALLPSSAAPSHHLADLLAESDRLVEGRRAYEHAIAIDPSYREGFASAGFAMYRDGRHREAAAAFQRTLALDPHNAHARLGLAWLDCRRKAWLDAETKARATVALDETLVDGHRTLGLALAKQRRDEEAIVAYERSLRLALAGGETFDELVATADGSTRLLDADHAAIHATLARLYFRRGLMKEAVAGYRIALAGGLDGVRLRCRLTRAHRALGNRRAAVSQSLEIAGAAIRQVKRAARRLFQ